MWIMPSVSASSSRRHSLESPQSPPTKESSRLSSFSFMSSSSISWEIIPNFVAAAASPSSLPPLPRVYIDSQGTCRLLSTCAPSQSSTLLASLDSLVSAPIPRNTFFPRTPEAIHGSVTEAFPTRQTTATTVS